MSKQSLGKNDRAWEHLFQEFDILNRIATNNFFIISADKIRKYREPRLMAKFDHKINLPKVFKENKLSILPISRGEYIISNFEAYKKFSESDSSIIKASLPNHIQSIDSNNISSEAIAINCALASGILQDFLNEEDLISTVSGRMGSDVFEFNIKNLKTNGNTSVKVQNSQIEIDAAFEGRESLSLIEAKRDISEDFLIRQLYYPFRLWSSRITKQVRPIFLVYSNGIFTLSEYEFLDPMSYNSLTLINQKNYSIEDTVISLNDIESILENPDIHPEPEIPFPQADSFKRIINLCELLSVNPMTREDVTAEYDFNVRQTNYYTDACRYLGLLIKNRVGNQIEYSLSKKGFRILKLPYSKRQLELCKCILQHKVFHDILCIYMERGVCPNKRTVVEIMKRSSLYKVRKESTYKRRASTVIGWIDWIIELINE